MSAHASHPWDQQPDEPASAYTRFLVFLHLGPARSLDAAYRLVRGVTEGDKRRTPAPGRRPRRRTTGTLAQSPGISTTCGTPALSPSPGSSRS